MLSVIAVRITDEPMTGSRPKRCSSSGMNTPDKFEFKKYDPVVRKHVIFKEAKIK